MLQLNIIAQDGYPDVSVTTKNKNTFMPELGWVDPNPAYAGVIYRNVGLFPLRLKNGGPNTVIGPNIVDNPDEFITSPMIPGLKILKGCIRFAILTERDDIIKETVLSVPFAGLLKQGVVRLEPGESVFAHLKYCLLDKTGVPNTRSDVPPEQRRLNGLFIEFDWMGKIDGGYCNIMAPARFYSYQVRHSQDLDIP